MKKKTIFLPMMAATLLLAACQQQGGQGGGFKPHDEDEEPIAVLHLEQAEHYSADGDWSNSGRGPGETPVYEKSSASDGTCIAYFDEGDKETLTFTSDKAISAELCITMGNNNSFESLAEVEEVKLNNKAINLEEVAYESDNSSGSYSFTEVSFGRVDIKAGNNVLEFAFLASAPYMDDVNIYSKDKATITTVPAQQKDQIIVTNEVASLTIEEGGSVQLVTATTGVSYTSSNEAIAEVSDSGLVTGVAKGSATITVSKEGMVSAKVAITVTEKLFDNEIRVQIETGTSENDVVTFRTSYNTDTSIVDAWPQDAVLTLTFESKIDGLFDLYLNGRASGGYSATSSDNAAEKMEIKVNNNAVTLSGEIAGGAFGYTKIGSVTLTKGQNTMTVKSLTEEITTIDFFRLLPVAA